MASILVKLGVLDPNHPATLKRRNAPVLNRRDIITGYIRPATELDLGEFAHSSLL